MKIVFQIRKWASIKSVTCNISNTPITVICNKVDHSGYVVHNINSYISEDIVLKHTSAKFGLVICKNEVNRKQAL